MATYRAYPSASVGSALADASVNLGTEFYVTQAGCTVTEVHWLQPNSGGDTSDRYISIYSVQNGSSSSGGTVVAGPFTVPNGSTAGGWRTFTLPTPLALTANQRYRVVTRHPTGNYAVTSQYYSAGPGSSDLVVGPLVIPDIVNSSAGKQGSYAYHASDSFPFQEYNGANYWNDLTISDNAGATIPSATLTGSYSFTGSSVGKRTPKASISGTFSFLGSATGKRAPKSSSTGTYSFAGSATGKRVPKAFASGVFSFFGSATGKRSPKASLVGSWTYVGVAQGITPVLDAVPTATLLGSWSFTGSATGKRTPKAALAGTYVFTSTPVQGKRRPQASLTGTHAWSGSATGRRNPLASLAGSYEWSGQATGKRSPKALLTGAFSWVGSAVGQSGQAVLRDMHVSVLGPFARSLGLRGPMSRASDVTGPRSRPTNTTGPRS